MFPQHTQRQLTVCPRGEVPSSCGYWEGAVPAHLLLVTGRNLPLRGERGALSDPSMRGRDCLSQADQCQFIQRSVCLEVRVSLSRSAVGAEQPVPLKSA